MRNAVVGGALAMTLLVGLVIGWMTTSNADAQRPTRNTTATPPLKGGWSQRGWEDPSLVAMSTEVDDRRTQLTLIDPNTRALVVYHIDKTSGEVSLRSVRNFHWDLQMDEFNGKNPLPREIRSLLETR